MKRAAAETNTDEQGQAGSMALSLRSDYFWHCGVGLLIRHTDADRVGRLMDLARWWWKRGEGKWARYAATAAREMRRKEFPNAAQRSKRLALEQPCPAVVRPAPAVVEAEYENLYVAHFAARKEEA